jgi:hypothetical protein
MRRLDRRIHGPGTAPANPLHCPVNPGNDNGPQAGPGLAPGLPGKS